MRKRIYSYVPETSFLKRVENLPTQASQEACVLFDPEDRFRVVACQGKGISVGQKWDVALALAEKEVAFLREHAPRNTLSLVYGKGEAWLIFSAFYSATGLLFGVRPSVNGEAFCRWVARDGLFLTAMSPAATEAASLGQGGEELSLDWTSNALRAVADILRHFLRAEKGFNLTDHVCWLARFAGCPVEERSAIEAVVPASLSAKLTAYLLCLFLALRGNGGRWLTSQVGIGAGFDAGLTLEWRMLGAEKAQTWVDSAALADFPEFDFLSRPCFHLFRLAHTSQGLCLRLRVLPSTYRLRARAEHRVASLLISGLSL